MAVTKRQVSKVIVIVTIALAVTLIIFLMVFRVQIFSGPVFHIKFDHVGSLTSGAVVRTAGVRIGTVTDIAINPDDFRTVIVTVTLYPNEKVRKGSRFLVMSGSLIGDQYIEVLPVAQGAFITGGETFTGEPIKNLDSFLLSSDTLIKDFTTAMSTLADILSENKDDIHEAIANINAASASLKEYMSEDKGGGPSLLKKLSTLLDNLDRSSTAMTKVLEDLSSKDSVVTLLNQKETTSDMKITLSNLKKISENLESVASDLKTLMKDVVGPSPTPVGRTDDGKN
ncbi:MAG: MCE family protein [Spirochaetales bacterium]|nr:MCE family protein [Spirochaetales bacterium]